MYSNVMVPTDGSEASRHAIPLALAIARPANAALHLVAVMETGFVAPIYGIPVAGGGMTSGALADPVFLASVTESERTMQRRALDEFAEHLAAETGVSVTPTLADGDVPEALSRYAESHAVDLIAIATHGRGGLRRAVLGSVTESLVQRVSCPVLVARTQGTLDREGEPAEIAHILVAVDGSPESDIVVSHAADIAHVTAARVTLLHVSHEAVLVGVAAPDIPVDPNSSRRTEDIDREHLARFAEVFRVRSVDVTTVVVRSNSPKRAIVDYAGEHAVGLIAMATHARRGVEKALAGSVATSVLHETRLPMLLLNVRRQLEETR